MHKQWDGWLSWARRAKCAHWDERPQGETINLIVIHNISLPPRVFRGDAVEKFFAGNINPQAHPFFATIAHLRVSAHFFIRRDGELIQFVNTQKRAWHAGVSRWRGRERCNDFSIGIEMEGVDDRPYTQRQYQRLRRLIASLQKHYPINAIVGHSDIAPIRKTDPGDSFDWQEIDAVMPHARIARNH